MEHVKDFVDSIAAGKNMDAESSFNQALAQKVGSALETKRVEVASTFVTDHIPEVEKDSE